MSQAKSPTNDPYLADAIAKSVSQSEITSQGNEVTSQGNKIITSSPNSDMD